MVNQHNHHELGGAADRDDRSAQPTIDEGWWSSLLSDEERIAKSGPKTSSNQNSYVSKRSGELIGGHVREKGWQGQNQESEFHHQTDSFHPSAEKMDWEFIEAIFASDETLSLSVSGHNRGGLLVSGENVHGFLPISHLVGVSSDLAVAPENDRDEVLATYVGSDLDVKVIECDRDRGRVVFSERAAQASAGRRNELLNELKPGECVQGVITNLTDFGVFIDLGGVEGLVHISEISWGRVRHPEDLLSVGEQITAYVISIDRERGRIALSLKRLCSNPWTTVDQRYKIGEVVDVTVTSLVPFGAFARVEEGLDGLIHISEMGEGEQLLVEEGQLIRARILHIDASRQRLGLSLNVE